MQETFLANLKMQNRVREQKANVVMNPIHMELLAFPNRILMWSLFYGCLGYWMNLNDCNFSNPFFIRRKTDGNAVRFSYGVKRTALAVLFDSFS